jgi:hypothetical protein
MLKFATKFPPTSAALEMAYRAGFRFAELWLDSTILADWQTPLQVLRDYPFTYAMHFPNRLERSQDVIAGAVGLYRQLGCRCLVIHQPHFDRYHEALTRLHPELQLAIENHKLTSEDFNRWAERSPGLTLDVEHLWKFTLKDAPLESLLARLRTFLADFGHKLRHVHLPGYWPGFEEHRPVYCSREMVFPVLSSLADARFDGLVVSEVLPAFQNPDELRMDVLLFDAWRQTHRAAEQTGT